MTPLEPPDSMHLEAAQGWVELGNYLEANEELKRIAPQLRSHTEVLEVRWWIYEHAKKWDVCLDIADAIIRLASDHAEAWVRCSFALHKLKRFQEAYNLLQPVADKFSNHWMVPYNLSRHCAQLGRLGECWEWFKKAMAVNEHAVKQVALDDPALKPLWESSAGTRWKRTG